MTKNNEKKKSTESINASKKEKPPIKVKKKGNTLYTEGAYNNLMGQIEIGE